MPRLPSGPPRDRNDNEVEPFSWNDEAHEARWDWAQKLIDASARMVPDVCVADEIGYEARGLPGASLPPVDATEVLMLNAAFYRHEMHNKRPPPSLCVDVAEDGVPLERTEPPGAFLRDMNAEQDRVLQMPTADSRKTKPEWWCNPQRLFARKPEVALQALIAHNRRPSVPFEQERDSSVEALHRMLQVLSLYFWYDRPALSRALLRMRLRACVLAKLRGRRKWVECALEKLAPVVRAPSPLVRIVREGASDELGQALWPYVRCADSHAIMRTCKTLHAWGLQFSRQLQLQLFANGNVATAANLPRSGTDPDGTPVLSISKVLKMSLQFCYEIDSTYVCGGFTGTVAHERVPVPDPGTGVDRDASTYTVELVRDDDPDGPAVANGVRNAELIIRPPSTRLFSRLRYTAHRTSREVGGARSTKLRLRVTAHVATRSSLRRAKERDSRRAMAARYTVLSPAFRVVARYATPRAREAERGRKQALAAAKRAAGQAMVELAAQNSARAPLPDPDPDPDPDPLALDVDALHALLGEGD